MQQEEQFINVGEVQLHVIIAGPKEGEPVVLLHGFPEFWYGWKNQISFLAEHGFRVIVPDQRGYNLSDKPQGAAAYHVNKLAQDIVGLMDALGYQQVNLAGHDWGAAVAWTIADNFPQRLKRLMILNVPHPRVMIQSMRAGNFRQLLKSWYMFYFQIPALPERMLSADDYNPMVRAMYAVGRKDSFVDADFEQYKQAWKQPGALTAMINWYRAAIRASAPGLASAKSPAPRITVPTLMLWGEQDGALGKELAPLSIAICDDGELIFFPEASHWVQHDKPAEVNQHMLRFFQTGSRG